MISKFNVKFIVLHFESISL